jgi:hypothetical protein
MTSTDTSILLTICQIHHYYIALFKPKCDFENKKEPDKTLSFGYFNFIRILPYTPKDPTILSPLVLPLPHSVVPLA